MDRIGGVGGVILAAAILLTARDFMSKSGESHAAQADDSSFKAAEPKMKSRFMVPTLKFLYWYVYICDCSFAHYLAAAIPEGISACSKNTRNSYASVIPRYKWRATTILRHQ
jgi:hypothetical protein